MSAKGEDQGSGECGLSLLNGLAKGFSSNPRLEGVKRSSKPSMEDAALFEVCKREPFVPHSKNGRIDAHQQAPNSNRVSKYLLHLDDQCTNPRRIRSSVYKAKERDSGGGDGDGSGIGMSKMQRKC